MRLIDADEFIANLKDYINKPMTAGLCATLIELAPTAYDVDKVVEDIMETYGCHDCEQADTMTCNECPVLEVLNDICEIVKQGGTYDDVCEWIKYDYRTICPKNHDANNPYWRIPDNTDKLKYCPYCGKKIKIVGD